MTAFPLLKWRDEVSEPVTSPGSRVESPTGNGGRVGRVDFPRSPMGFARTLRRSMGTREARPSDAPGYLAVNRTVSDSKPTARW